MHFIEVDNEVLLDAKVCDSVSEYTAISASLPRVAKNGETPVEG